MLHIGSRHEFWVIERGNLHSEAWDQKGKEFWCPKNISCNATATTLVCFCCVTISCWNLSSASETIVGCVTQHKNFSKVRVFCDFIVALTPAPGHSWTYNLTFIRKLWSCLCLCINKKYRFHLFKLAKVGKENFPLFHDSSQSFRNKQCRKEKLLVDVDLLNAKIIF